MFVAPGDPVPEWVKSPKAEKWLTPTLYASVMRREVFQAVGTFNPTMRIGEDMDWYLRAREAGLGWDTLDPVLVAHRVRKESLTGHHDRLKQDMIRVARLSLQRRRAAAL
jgi:GT2 family glycosyltransferase